ncbi:MAG: Panacea domain-containing protein [Flavobacteriaceae bacterium]|nr:Panacea domain-containing protein [Flavobacteriaceae bacterium]
MKSLSKYQERISEPKLDIEKFKQVLFYIIYSCKDKPNVGKTVICKLLYYSDFNYYELYEEQMTGETYLKFEHGPIPKHLNQIMDEFKKSNWILEKEVQAGGYPMVKYIPCVKPSLKTLNRREKKVIDDVIHQLSHKSAKDISEYSHNDVPWRVTEPNDVIDYELAFYREEPYTVREYDLEDEF